MQYLWERVRPRKGTSRQSRFSGDSKMTTEDTQFTVGKTTFYQGEHGTHPLFRIEPGIPCRDAREQSWS